MEELKVKLLANIANLKQKGKLEEARQIVEQYLSLAPQDIAALQSKVDIMLAQAEDNQARIVLELILQLPGGLEDCLGVADKAAKSKPIKYIHLLQDVIEKSENELWKKRAHESLQPVNMPVSGGVRKKRKIVFFVKPGMDSFLMDIINGLADKYETEKVIVENVGNIEAAMKRADICWFEWCDELLIYASRLKVAHNKKIVCRLHSGEVFVDYPRQVNWCNVNALICVADHIKELVLEQCAEALPAEKIFVIPNGIALEKYAFRERQPGKKIAFLGYVNYKKGPMLLMHVFKALRDVNPEYELHIAGTFQDRRDALYFRQMIEAMNMDGSVFYHGWQDDVDAWLDEMDYILCTSILESQGLGIMQAMAKGIKPAIHNFFGAKKVYGDKYLWTMIDECVQLITSHEYNSAEYRELIAKNYALPGQIKKIKEVLAMVDK